MPETMTAMAEEMNPYAIALEQLASVAAILGLDDDIHAILQKPKRELTVHFPVNMESGGTQMFTGRVSPALCAGRSRKFGTLLRRIKWIYGQMPTLSASPVSPRPR